MLDEVERGYIASSHVPPHLTSMPQQNRNVRHVCRANRVLHRFTRLFSLTLSVIACVTIVSANPDCQQVDDVGNTRSLMILERSGKDRSPAGAGIILRPQ